MNFKKQLTLTIGITVGAAIIFGGIILFLSSDISSKIKEIEYGRNTLGFRIQAADSLVLLREDYSNAQQYEPALNTILPTRDQLVSFPRELTNSAKNQKINLNVSLGEEKLRTQDQLGTIEFTMSGQGKFDDFISFLKEMETGRYSVRLENLDFTRQGDIFRTLLKGKVFSF